jgi:hypothetical protein
LFKARQTLLPVRRKLAQLAKLATLSETPNHFPVAALEVFISGQVIVLEMGDVVRIERTNRWIVRQRGFQHPRRSRVVNDLV